MPVSRFGETGILRAAGPFPWRGHPICGYKGSAKALRILARPGRPVAAYSRSAGAPARSNAQSSGIESKNQ